MAVETVTLFTTLPAESFTLSLASFWKPIQLLLRGRRQVARNALAANPTAVLWTLLVTLILLLAALGMGSAVGTRWSALSREQAGESLGRLWLLMQSFWLLALLFPGGIALLGQIPPRAALRPFALRPIQVFIAEASAGLLDTPSLLACAMTFPLLCILLAEAEWRQAVVTLLAFVLLGLQTGVCARLLACVGTLGARRLRRLADAPGMTALLLVCLCAGVPPAFASLTPSPAHHSQLSSQRGGISLPSAPALPSVNSAVENVGNALAPLLPSRLAAHAVVATRQEDYTGALGSLGGMAVCLVLTGGSALWALRSAEKTWTESEGRASAPPGRRRPRSLGTSHADVVPLRSVALRQTIALIRTEWRLLLRAPQNYLPLRKPASLLLLGAFAFLSPDMSRSPVYNLKEFAGIGALMYGALWQMQLLCNRFGSEAGTGALLFGFSLPRRRLLLGKNIALFGLLLVVDGPALVGLSYVADASRQSGVLLLWLPLILLVLTALGNVVSVLRPFAIARQANRGSTEPPDTLAWAYAFVGAATVALLAPVAELLSRGVVGMLGIAVYLTALYAASLYGASALLTRREYQMIAALNRNN